MPIDKTFLLTLMPRHPSNLSFPKIITKATDIQSPASERKINVTGQNLKHCNTSLFAIWLYSRKPSENPPTERMNEDRVNKLCMPLGGDVTPVTMQRPRIYQSSNLNVG